jgi:hypothetical protein
LLTEFIDPATPQSVMQPGAIDDATVPDRKREENADVLIKGPPSPSVRWCLKEATMSCLMCQGDGKKLYRLPVSYQLGSVPLYSACYFCYLRITSASPPSEELVPESRDGTRT